MFIHLFRFLKILTFTFLFFSLKSYSQDNIWQKINYSNNSVNASSKEKSSVYKLSSVSLERELNKISEYSSGVLGFPVGDDNLKKFMVRETKVMHPDLARKFPSIKSYKGVALDGDNRIIQFTYSAKTGFYGYLEKDNNVKIQIKPITNSFLHQFKEKTKDESSSPFDCGTEAEVRKQYKNSDKLNRNVNDGNLRRFRLALSVSGDYSQVFLDGTEADDVERKTKVLQAMVGSVNRLNGIFERDLGITMQLIANTDLFIFLNPETDPYSTQINLRSELSNTINTIIDDNDYDVGHLFHKENAIYGNAGCIACVCTSVDKGKAYSVHRNPDEDGMNLLAAHEFGHQFGAYHTQSSSNCRSGYNSEVEPGSGSTIMSYAGICSPNVQESSDDYFNYTSIRDIALWTINNSNCAELLPIDNQAPTVDAGEDYIIPHSTPFVLTGNISDPDGNDTHTYCWEQNDAENPNSIRVPSSTSAFGPMFRSLYPTTSNERYFPNLNDIISNNLTPTWEVLPSVTRELNFVLTVRDNNLNEGQIVSDAVKIKVNDQAGPFAVTSQSDSGVIWTVGDEVTVTWDVANTNASPVNTSNVEILLSTNGGVSFQTILVTTENDGEETFNLPDVDASLEARVMIKAIGNVFFAVNQQNFIIQKSEYAILSDEQTINVCDNDDAVFNLEYKTFLNFSEEVSISGSNLPPGTSVTFSEDTFNGNNESGFPFVVTLSGIDSLAPGDYNFNVEGLSTSSVEKSINLSFTVFTDNNVALNLLSPVNEIDLQEVDLEFSWDEDENSVSYQIEIALDDTFTNVIDTFITTDTIFVSSNIEYDKQYYWRVKTINPCGESNYSEVYSFFTRCSSPENFRATNIETNLIEVVWEDSASNTSWTVEYGLAGFSLGSGISTDVISKQFIAESLETGTKYDFYIKGNCSSDSGLYLGPYSLSTISDYCNGDHFYDSGGVDGNYSSNEYTTTQVYPDTNENRVRVVFNSFNVEYGYDALYVFDGESDRDNLLGGYTGNQLQGREFVSKHPSGALTFVFISNGAYELEGWDATVICEDKPNCLEPENFNMTSIDAREVSFEWLPIGDDTNWELEYELTGFSKGAGVVVSATEPTITLSDLEPLTTYDIYIKTVCDVGGFSESLGPFTFRTTEVCTVPTNWNLLSISRDSAEFTWDDNENVDEWEIEYYSNYFTPGTGVGTLVSSSTNSVVLENLIPGTSYYAYVRGSCGTDGYSNWSYTQYFYTNQACEIPYGVTAQEITKNSAEIVWDSNDDVTEWEIEYNTNYFTPGYGTGTVVTSSTNSISLEDLLISTNYYVYVRSDCDSYGYSNWSNYSSFKTEDLCAEPNGFNTNVITTDSVSLVWDNDDSIAEWEIEYGAGYFNPGYGIGTVVTTSINSLEIEGLSQDTNYYVYLRGNCGIDGFSKWVRLSFNTDVACYVPNNLTTQNITKNSADLSWYNQAGATEWEVIYKVGYFTPDDGTGTIVTSSTNSITLEGLLPASYYYYYVRSSCDANGYSNWSYYRSFTTQDACIRPNGLTTNLITTDAVSLVWDNNDNDVTEWEIEYKAGYFNPGYGEGTLITSSINAIDIEGLVQDTYYNVYVRGNCSTAGYSNWARLSFNTQVACYIPINLSALNITKNSADLSWSNQVGATEWEVIYKADYFTPDDGTGTLVTSSTNSITIEGLLPVTYYYYYVRSNCDTNGYSNWSYNGYFRTEDICGQPNRFRADVITEDSVALLWDGNDDVTEWEIEYKSDYFNPGNGEGTLVTSSINSLNIEGLLQDTHYYAYVRGNCGTDGYSNWSYLSFRTDIICSAPYRPYVEEVTENIVTLNWYEQGNATEWEIIYKENYFTPDDETGTVLSSSTNSITIEDLLPTTSYYVYVRSNCGTDGYSNWSGYRSFTTLDACKSPNNLITQNITKDSVNLLWEADDDVTEWEVAYNPGYFTPGTGVGLITTSSTNSISIEDLLPDTYYYAFVRGNCGIDGYSDWSYYRTFRTDVVCGIPKNIIVSNVTKSSMQLTWDLDANILEWEVEYSNVAFTPGNGTGTVQNTSTNSINIDNLNSNTRYFFFVRKKCEADGYSDWTSQMEIITLADFCQGDHFYDSGGASGNYQNRENITTVIAPKSDGERVRVTFNNFSVETCCDRLSVYDGPSNLSPLIGTYTTIPLGPIVSSHESGTLTFVFTSDGSSTRSGWDATVVCEPIPICTAPINFVNVYASGVEAMFSWEGDDAQNSWTLEYGLEGFSLGNGTEIISNINNATITSLNSNTAYDIYIKANCELGTYSEWVGPLNFETYCNTSPEANEYIANGSFECGSLDGWGFGGSNTTDSCGTNFTVLSNSNTICNNIIDEISPTNGIYAAYTSFEGSANSTYNLYQTIDVPSNIDVASSALLSFDFKVNYRMIFNNPSEERVFTVRFIDLDGLELFKVDEISFGITPSKGSIDLNFSEDILSELEAYAGESIVLSFEAFIPQNYTGGSKALVDNVSLVIDVALSNEKPILSNDKLRIYPNPNNGKFTIENRNGLEINAVEIFDVSGRLITKNKLSSPSNKTNINLNHVDSGVYFVKIHVYGTTSTRRIIIE